VLAEHVKEEIAAFLRDELKLELNRDKTSVIHLPTTKARFLGYEVKAATACGNAICGGKGRGIMWCRRSKPTSGT
jgi:hypothetical protein